MIKDMIYVFMHVIYSDLGNSKQVPGLGQIPGRGSAEDARRTITYRTDILSGTRI